MDDDLDFDDLPPAMPAATLVLFRDRAGQAPEILMVERSKGMRFAGGAIVFPGGRVDDDDHVVAANHATTLEPDCAAARVAAIRETIEESGIPIGILGEVSDDWLDVTRAALHAQQPFSALLAEAGLSLDLHALIPFARWRPKHKEARVFDTRFYIAKAPDNLPEEVVDATENVRTFWESAAGAIELEKEGKVKVIFPTMRNLERLALFGSYEEAEAHSLDIPVKMISPHMEKREDGLYLCIPTDAGYPVTSERLDQAVTAFPMKAG
jgi:8-oxo-dGTP pyrophosphatase MutT (NUDIX family)